MKRKTIEVDLGDQVIRFNQEAIDRELAKAARDRLPKDGTSRFSRVAIDLTKDQALPKK